MKNEPAYPVPEENRLSNGEYNNAGLTKRELFAAMAMQSLFSQASLHLNHPSIIENVCASAVRIADGLIKELQK